MKNTTKKALTEVRYRTFEAVYKGPTNTRGSRIIIKDLRRDKSITIPYNYEFNCASDIARAHLESIGIAITGYAMLSNDVLLLTEDFETELRKA